MEELNPKEILICGGCLNDISDDDYVSALSQDWHRDCFRCSVCDDQLTTWFFEKGGMLFCREDYWKRFGDSCQRCGQVVCGAVMAAGELRFHPECFACAACGTPLGDSEPYALLDRDTLYCGPCTPTRVSRVPARAPRVTSPPTPPAGALVTHPPASALLRAALAACLQRVCARLDAGGTLALRVACVLDEGGGDLQAVPGERGHDKRAQKIRNNIQPVIENNPDTINVKRGSSEYTIQETPKINFDGTNENCTDTDTKREEAGVRRERLFKRKGEDGGKVRVMKKRQTPSSPLLGEKERSSSMSKLLDVAAGSSPGGDRSPGVLDELSRARSFRAHTHTQQRVFRDADLLQGELLGTGFFGHVYKVTHRTTGELMVLKQLYRVDDAAQNNFLKEVAVLRSLRHRNVLRFEGVLYRERLHLVTEYVAGGTLHHLLQDKSRPLSWEARVRLARDVAAGVGYLHCRHVIHRDLNSHNCLIRPGEELSVVVADFGLARIVRQGDRTASSRKRYTVVGNPYWMAPEMMNGNLYDEKVDVFSFGIILCEIIGRVSADPDYMPRRSDFGLNERVFREKFCATCPEPFYRLAFLACQLDPDARPPFEVMEVWLESLVAALWSGGTPPPALLEDVLQYAARHGVQTSGEGDSSSLAEGGAGDREEAPDSRGVVKSQSTAELEAEMQACGSEVAGRALGKCVSAGALCAAPGAAPPRRAASTQALTPGYILRKHEHGINVTKVADISSWVEGALRRTPRAPHLPAFMRNQSEEGLQTCTKHEIHPTLSFDSRGEVPAYSDSDSSDDDPVSPRPLPGLPLGLPIDTAKKSGSLLSARASYDVTEPPPTRYRERNVDDVDCRRFNIDYLKKSPVIANWIENIPKTLAVKPTEKPSFFTKTLGSPKLRRLFRPSTAEPVGRPETDREERSKSNFFVQRPTSAIRSSYRVRPATDERNNLSQNVLKCDIKLANMGTPMTPTFRRHLPADGNFKDGRFSHRERRREPPGDSALTEKNKGRDDKEAPKRRPIGISRSNYVKLENLRISKDGAHLV